MTHAPVQAVTFDLWGTLIKSDPGFKPRRNEMIRTIFNAPVDADLFTTTLKEQDAKADVLSIGDGTDYGFDYRITSTLDAAGVDVDSDPDHTAYLLGKAHAEQTLLALQYPARPIADGVVEALAELAQQVPLAIISNTGMLEGALMRKMLSMSGLQQSFSVEIFSNEVTRCKPWPEIFDASFTGLSELVPGLSKENIVHLGDNYVADVCGAKGFGTDARLVNVAGAPPVLDVIRDLIKETA